MEEGKKINTELEENRFDYKQLRHLTDKEAEEAEGGFLDPMSLISNAISFFQAGYDIGKGLAKL